jgi:hypothetical protein
MLRKSLNKTIFAVLFIFVFSSAALALSPHDAISKRSANDMYAVLSMNNVNGLLQEIFSPANIAMFTPLLEPDQVQGVNIAAGFASQIPANTLVIAAGMTNEMMPFVQVAASMPASVRSKLDRIADGTATGPDIVTLLLGDAALIFAAAFTPEVQKGDMGPYYSIENQVVFTAKDDLLLIATSLAYLEASIGALEKKENRLAFKRRFDSPNYLLMHVDFLSYAQLFKALGDEVYSKLEGATKKIKAPIEFEYALTIKPGSYLLSCAINFFEAFVDAENFKDIKPVKGGGLFLAGGGRLLFAFSSPLVIKGDDFKAYPESAKVWEQFIGVLEPLGISESDIESILDGYLSLAFGSEATVMGKKVPGGYITLTGREGAASKIFEKLMSNPMVAASIPLTQLKVKGWDTLYTVNQEVVPIPVLFGVMKDTLFLGLVDSSALDKKPETSSEVSKMLGNPLIGAGVIDTEEIWNLLRKEVSDPESLLSMVPGIEDAKGVLEELLKADLSIPLIKIWNSALDHGFVEISIANVSDEKRLLPILAKIGQMFK